MTFATDIHYLIVKNAYVTEKGICQGNLTSKGNNVEKGSQFLSVRILVSAVP